MVDARRGSISRLTAAVIAATVLTGCANAQAGGGQPSRNPSPVTATTAVHAPAPATESLVVPAPLFDPSIDLRAAPVNVPLELRLPSLRLTAPVLGVGLNAKNVMDTPLGSASAPVWREVFWYRGGGIPGDATTATIAGHVDDVLGRPAIFARLKDLRVGDTVTVRDTRTGLAVDFLVTRTITYTLKQTVDPTVLAQIYGPGPVAGQGPEPSPDGLSHLTLITCTGNWIGSAGTFDHRLVVYAVGIPSAPTPGRSRS
jgi:sortase family protein